mmetsp:Transcript_2363/g.5930  ORF Transcript_2363/g.5930 Transcript_2363/m.5930 type:complete len:239 (+) Transcript_2363:481-1197(+)
MEPSTVAGPRCDSGRRHQALAKLKNRRAAGSADGEGQQGAPDQHGTEAPSSSDTNQERAAAILQPSAPIPGVGPLSRTVKQLVWLCEECGNECVPIREESRCLCGHRMKEHEKADHSNPYQCKNTRCSCRGFFLIVAEGSWVLRCRCKHRHTDHDARTHKCTKPNCACHEFHSPWVCNCNHPWGRHKQVILDREVLTLEGMMAACTVEENWAEGSIPHVPVNHFETEVNRFDMLKRGL